MLRRIVILIISLTTIPSAANRARVPDESPLGGRHDLGGVVPRFVLPTLPKAEPAIFGGEKLNYPAVVQMGHAESDDLKDFHPTCSSTLVSQNTLITAAHCVKGFKNFGVWLRATTGEAALVQGMDCQEHPRYSTLVPESANDVAVCVFKKPANFGNLEHACVPSKLEPIDPNREYFYAGYGWILDDAGKPIISPEDKSWNTNPKPRTQHRERVNLRRGDSSLDEEKGRLIGAWKQDDKKRTAIGKGDSGGFTGYQKGNQMVLLGVNSDGRVTDSFFNSRTDDFEWDVKKDQPYSAVSPDLTTPEVLDHFLKLKATLPASADITLCAAEPVPDPIPDPVPDPIVDPVVPKVDPVIPVPPPVVPTPTSVVPNPPPSPGEEIPEILLNIPHSEQPALKGGPFPGRQYRVGNGIWCYHADGSYSRPRENASEPCPVLAGPRPFLVPIPAPIPIRPGPTLVPGPVYFVSPFTPTPQPERVWRPGIIRRRLSR